MNPMFPRCFLPMPWICTAVWGEGTGKTPAERKRPTGSMSSARSAGEAREPGSLGRDA